MHERKRSSKQTIGSAFLWNRVCDQRHTFSVSSATVRALNHRTGPDYAEDVFPRYAPHMTAI
jgi:hypothetical protein